MAFDPFGQLRNLSLQSGWGQSVFDNPKVNLTPGAGTKFFNPNQAPKPTNPALPMNPVLPGLPSTTPPPGTEHGSYGGTIGFQFGPQTPPGLPHTIPPAYAPPALGPKNPFGRSPTDRDYPFPDYLALLGIGNNLLI